MRLLDEAHARRVDDLVVELDIGVALGHLARDAQVQAVGRLHDVGLVHARDLLAAAATGVFEGVFHDALAARDGDRLDGDGGIGSERLLTGASTSSLSFCTSRAPSSNSMPA